MTIIQTTAATPGSVDMVVGYTDPVLGIANWPVTTAAWSVQPAPDDQSGATLAVRVAMQPGGLVPAGAAAGDATSANAADVASRFAAVWYQILQPDMKLLLTTSLNQPVGAAPLPLEVSIDGLRAHVSACYAFAGAAAALNATFMDPAITANLLDAHDHYGVDWQALGQAAGEQPLDTLLQIPDSGLSIPAFAVFVAAGTVSELVPEGLDPAAVLADADNTALPLNPGIELVIDSSMQAQPHDNLSLAALAEAFRITLASLVQANQQQPALLAPGFVFAAQGVEVEVPATGEPGADATLDDIALAFGNNGVPFDAVMAAVANADTPGMFRNGVSLKVDRILIVPGWTLADNQTGMTVENLAASNIATVDLFPAGTPLFLNATPVTGLGAAPLGACARAYAIEPGDLLRHNATLTPVMPSAGHGFPVPGLAALPAEPSSLRIPCRIRDGESMSTIAARFLSAAAPDSGASAEQALTESNRAMPGTLANGHEITVAGQTLTAQAGDSFDALIARANPPVTIDEFAAAIADDTQALAVGALLLCPPAQLPTDGAAVSPDALAATYGLDATLILSANAAIGNVIVADITLKPSPVAAQPTITTASADSINAIIRRFAAAGAAVTVGDVIRANHDLAFLAAGAIVLLPPADTWLRAPFGETSWQFPEVIFPLRSWVTLARNPALVDPAFYGSPENPGPVAQVASPIAVARSATPERQENGAVTLDVFAAALEQAIAGLKLATGQVLRAERDSAATDVWAVSFVEPSGITKVAISAASTLPGVDGAQPLSFALRPLSNTLESANDITIDTLDTSTGTWGGSEKRSYQGIDMETWAHAWLEGLDLLCTAPYAAPAYRVAPDPLARLLAAKKHLTCAVADGLSPILVPQAEHGAAVGTPAWQAAREVIYQRLLDQLVSAYNTSAILQFNADVSAPPSTSTARLSGAGKLHPSSHAVDDNDPAAWKESQLGNAKTSLANGSTGTVSFPLDVTQPSRHRAVTLQPTYAVNEVEFGITPVANDYVASNWLSFVRAFNQHPPQAFDAALGTPEVPIPLRTYPELPVLVSQSALTNKDPGSVTEALQWSYVFTYAHQSAAQDQLLLELEFNRRPSPNPQAKEDNGLFQALAQYAAISDSLWQILAELQSPDVNASHTVLAAALETYAELAEQVAARWAAWWGVGTCDPAVARRKAVRSAHAGLVHPSRHATEQHRLRTAAGIDSPPSGAPHEFYHFRATLDSEASEGVEVYITLTLKRVDADGDAAWPEIVAIRNDGQEIPLTGEPPSDDTRVYRFPDELGAPRVPAFSRLGFRYTIAGLHIARYQNANAAVSVIRNARLLGAAGPETCSAFVYRTPQLGFPEPLVPLIVADQRLDIGQWTQTAATNPLTALFDALFNHDPAGREIAVAARYGYTLAASTTAGVDPIETLLPVKLHPRFTYQVSATVQDIIDAVEEWANEVQPVSTGGLWGLGINLYSSTDPSLDRPLVELRRVVSPIH